ncbi:hypothetical protein F2P81_003693 [Scophthalmus maximus]|uniref:Uncharacterized protein n=1 Tax=Scophthalmus maximus TaxID=52904 RepID=A0A6A4TH50_SCOMX|nr:hypothetical protein F2P81_003693 [Scophthalmus maximus]
MQLADASPGGKKSHSSSALFGSQDLLKDEPFAPRKTDSATTVTENGPLCRSIVRVTLSGLPAAIWAVG